MRISPIVPALALAVGACLPAPSGVSPPSTVPSTTTASAPATTTPGPACGTADATMKGGAGSAPRDTSDAAVISSVSWHTDGACEQLDISFATAAGVPAVDPPSVAATIGDTGVLHITLGPTVTDTALFDQLVESRFIRRLYVVNALGGGLFIDVVLATDAAASVSARSSPGRIVVTLQAAPQERRSAPTIEDDVVITEPGLGEAGLPLTVIGYARTARTTVTATLTDSSGATIEASGPIASGPSPWGAYVMLFPQAASGPALLRVGTATLGLTLR